MADNSSSSVAMVAIVIIMIFAGAVAYYFIKKEGGLNTNANAPKVEVNLPSAPKAAE